MILGVLRALCIATCKGLWRRWRHLQALNRRLRGSLSAWQSRFVCMAAPRMHAVWTQPSRGVFHVEICLYALDPVALCADGDNSRGKAALGRSPHAGWK
jgi:hypothetical protein